MIWIVSLTAIASLYLFPSFAIGGIKPDFLLLFLIFYSFRISWKQAPLVAFLIGIIKDVFSVRVFGLETFSLVSSGFLARYLMGKIEREDFLILVSGGFVYAMFYESVCAAEYAFLERSFAVFSAQLVRGFWSALYTVCFLPLAFVLFEKLSGGRASIFAGREIR
ncbi:MAG TPA: rod shape-determining protein MreD [Candidatus Omnitrophota bacterium]|nr:rod shape-determining protein MreD [Candidatus Omnitrophota bacterium]